MQIPPGFDIVSEINARHDVWIVDVGEEKLMVAKRLNEQEIAMELGVGEVLREAGVEVLDMTVVDGWVMTPFVDEAVLFLEHLDSGTEITEKEWTDRVQIGVVDDVVGNRDRNRMNLLLTVLDGEERVIPIDHEATDPSRWGGVAPSASRAYKELGEKGAEVVAATLRKVSQMVLPAQLRRGTSLRSRMSLLRFEDYLTKWE